MAKKNNSLTRKIVIWILVIIIPITLFIVFENLYAINVVRNQVSISNQGTLRLYVQQILESLNGAEKYLANLTYNNEIITGSSRGNNDYEQYMQEQLLLTEVTSAKIVYPQIDGFFVASLEDHKIIKKTNGSEKLENLETIRKYLLALTEENEEIIQIHKGKWYGEKFGKDYYLLRIYKTSEYIIGAWINLDNLLAPLILSDFAFDKHLAVASKIDGVFSNDSLFSDDIVKKEYFGSNYSVLGDQTRYLLLSESLGISELYLVALIREKGILEGLDNLQTGITLISFLTLLVIPFSLYLVNRSILSPLKSIVKAMLKVKQGDLNAVIKEVPEYTEYLVVQETFKDMTDQIKTLKIDIYEEQIQKQNAQMQYFQLQISPHFIMNALNIIYGLAEVKKFEIIQEMTLSLVKYFRSLLSLSKMVRVSLVQELEHVKNYLKIQLLRFPEMIQYYIEEEPGLEEILVPPILLQSFVENSVKYALGNESTLNILIRLMHYENRLRIEIEDDGDGFGEEVVTLLNNRKFDDAFFATHIGIQNIIQRLDILYQKEYYITFSNVSTGGAKIEIMLPIQN